MVALQKETDQQKRLQFLQITANPLDAELVGEIGRARVLRALASDLGLPDDVVPDDDAIASQVAAKKQAQMAMIQQNLQQQKADMAIKAGPPLRKPASTQARPSVPSLKSPAARRAPPRLSRRVRRSCRSKAAKAAPRLLRQPPQGPPRTTSARRRGLRWLVRSKTTARAGLARRHFNVGDPRQSRATAAGCVHTCSRYTAFDDESLKRGQVQDMYIYRRSPAS